MRRHLRVLLSFAAVGSLAVTVWLAWMSMGLEPSSGDLAPTPFAATTTGNSAPVTTKKARLILLVPWYNETSERRRDELHGALASNVQLAQRLWDTDRVRLELVLVHDGSTGDGDPDLGPAADDGAWDEYVQFFYQGHPGRMNVSDALAVANRYRHYGSSVVVILANTDIVFDGSLRFIAEDPELQSRKRVMYALSRWEFGSSMRKPSMCSPAYQGSHDSFIFAVPVPDALLEATRFPVGAWGYENRLMYEFEHEAGYTVSNPCISVRSFHAHVSAIKSNQLHERINDRGRSLYARPAMHPLDLTPADQVFPLVDYIDMGEIARVLRRTKTTSQAALCEVPRRLDKLVAGFCQTYWRAGVHAWNCTHLPCALLTSATPTPFSCVVARSFHYQCRQHKTLVAAISESTATAAAKSVVFDGRFRVDATFFDALSSLLNGDSRRSSAWLYEFSGESLAVHPFAGEADLLRRFNWTIGYDKSVFNEQSVYFLEGAMSNYTTSTATTAALVDAWSARPGSVLFLASNCHDVANRITFVKMFMTVVAVDSVGACLHNRDAASILSAHEYAQSRGNPVLEQRLLLGKYKFVIAHENSIARDYITEKLWRPLAAGAIPIYVGAPNVAEYLPHPMAAIDATSQSTRSVAELVRDRLQDGDVAQHLEWHTSAEHSLSPWFQQAFSQRRHADLSPCGMCNRLHRFLSAGR